MAESNKNTHEAANRGRNQTHYLSAFEKSGAASIIIEPDMTIAMANAEFEKLSGYSKQEIENRMKWSAFVAPEDLERMQAYHYARRQGDEAAPAEYECRVYNRAGELRHIFMKVGMLPDGRLSIASFMDITSLKHTEKALKESEAKLRTIIEAVQGDIYICDHELRITFMNRGLIDKIGRDATGERCHEALYGLSQPCSWCSQKSVFGGGTERVEFEHPMDGRWYEAILSPIYEGGDAVSQLEALVIDITKRKREERALAERAAYLRKENVRLKSSMRERFRFGDIIGKSQPMQAVYDLILNAAATDANIIIYGESGTGKELVAKAIHENSDRQHEPFVVVNCGAIPETLLESEFFGYKKGAFTGAGRDKHGYLALADGGTLFLDELGEIGLNMQVKLLRVLEGHGYTPVGATQPQYPHIRFIGATHRKLRELVKSGGMREDFFYRIHVIPIHLPPLRERKEDLSLLVEHFRQSYPADSELPPITGEIMDAIYCYDWPGNVRELQNALHRYFTLHQFDILRSPESGQAPPPMDAPVELDTALAGYEKDLILSALENTKWHRGRAADRLGVNRRTLYKKMKKYGLDRS
ncbi:MAG: sigma 54-interacting transcriptional regulator [Desulfobacterales bacterium]|nr:sigma 54-interacting transcriptional regulator [Desulfobacterales bacterium]